MDFKELEELVKDLSEEQKEMFFLMSGSFLQQIKKEKALNNEPEWETNYNHINSNKISIVSREKDLGPEYLINKHLYFNKYIIVKEINTIEINYPSLFDSPLTFRAEFAYLTEGKGEETLLALLPDPSCDYLEDETDLTEELKKYCPNPEIQGFYFHRKVFKNNKELPLLNSCLIKLVGYDIAEEAEDIYLDQLEEIIGFVRNLSKVNFRKIKTNPKLTEIPRLLELFETKLLELYLIENFDLTTEGFESIDDEKFIKTVKELFKSYTQYYNGCPALYYWMKELVKSALEVMSGRLLVCEECGELMKWARGKKRCNIDKDEKNCVKKASNKTDHKRNYPKRKLEKALKTKKGY